MAHIDSHETERGGTKISRKRNLNPSHTHTNRETNENVVALHFLTHVGTEFPLRLPDFATQFSLPRSVNFLPYLEAHKTSNF